MRLGLIDVGSNTVHLSIVEGARGTPPLPVCSQRTRLRLAETVRADHSIGGHGIRRLVAAVTADVTLCRERQVDELLVVGSAAIRDAPNGGAVVEALQKAAGVDLQRLTGEQEARLTFVAARRWFGWSAGPMVMVDIGGGSLEIAVGRDEFADFAVSYPLGAGRATRDWLSHDPPTAVEVRALRHHVRDQIEDCVNRMRWSGGSPFAVGTSKTFKLLARLAGAAPQRAGPFVPRYLRRSDARRWEQRITALDLDGRASLRGVSKARAKQLVAGVVIARTAMQALDLDYMSVSPWALREGIILGRLDLAGEPTDPRFGSSRDRLEPLIDPILGHAHHPGGSRHDSDATSGSNGSRPRATARPEPGASGVVSLTARG